MYNSNTVTSILNSKYFMSNGLSLTWSSQGFSSHQESWKDGRWWLPAQELRWLGRAVEGRGTVQWRGLGCPWRQPGGDWEVAPRQRRQGRSRRRIRRGGAVCATPGVNAVAGQPSSWQTGVPSVNPLTPALVSWSSQV